MSSENVLTAEKKAAEKKAFIDDKNVIVYEHFVVDAEIFRSIANHIGKPHDPAASTEMKVQLDTLIGKIIIKYDDLGLKRHIKLIYLFLMEGTHGAVAGRLLEPKQEEKIKQAFNNYNWAAHPDFPTVKVLGIEEMGTILTRIAANNPGLNFKDFLLGDQGKWGYDTPKIASAFIQLARQKYERQEMFIRLDDDVTPHEDGIKRLKEVWYDLVYSHYNKQFCFSWNYFAEPLKPCDHKKGPDYDTLFKHFVNSYSIRTTFLGDPECLCKSDPTGKLFCKHKAKPEDECNTSCRLNIIHVKHFVEMFQQGKWGSNLNDPISGAGLCFSADSLRVIPPWCNTDEMITWIDDMGKYELMKMYYGNDFEHKKALLSDSYIKGFKQNRHPKPFNHDNVKWATNVYLDRLLMGCIFAFALNPAKYGSKLQGYGQILKETSYGTAFAQWSQIREPLLKEAQAHIQKVIQDWYYYFCEKKSPVSPGYIHSAQPLHGFIPVSAEHFFNAYVIKQLLLLKDDKFDLTKRVFNVFDRYLRLKYIFWTHVVASIDTDAAAYQNARITSTLANFMDGGTGWLYSELPNTDPVPKECGRNSDSSVALIKSEKGTWLVQWNSKWKVMNLISGHKESIDSGFTDCIMREIHEELFTSLSLEDFNRLKAATGGRDDLYEDTFPAWKDPHIKSVKLRNGCPYTDIDFSDSANCWTQYKFYIYDVELKSNVQLFHDDLFYTPSVRQSPRAPNEWISIEDVQKGWTKMGRPISRTVKKILEWVQQNP